MPQSEVAYLAGRKDSSIEYVQGASDKREVILPSLPMNWLAQRWQEITNLSKAEAYVIDSSRMFEEHTRAARGVSLCPSGRSGQMKQEQSFETVGTHADVRETMPGLETG